MVRVINEPMGDELTVSEQAELAECEAMIDCALDKLEAHLDHGLEVFHDSAGPALLKVRDKRLYRAKYRTFERYCRERWKKGKTRAYQLMEAIVVVSNLSTMVDKFECQTNILPQNERQVRPLVSLEPDQQREAWQSAVEAAAPKPPTGRDVAAAARSVREMTPTPPPPTPRELQAEQRAREAEEQAAKLRREQQDREHCRFIRFRKFIAALDCIAAFHLDGIADIWDGLTSARADEDVEEDIRRAIRLLTRMQTDHPNGARALPTVTQGKPN